eukprot:CAMPEP_0206823076 /NCGR_PEP_ID=MMETSP0975-20121206/13140_1 /ASSEMBLY_ACC=CAM_ASM_000399 /TAXON_ID=483370 /ORGANISM="non described non described, Strain CCMP2097" /LENGTH=81 /DNA_ID=CAMNT_0054365325 /DNA_START=26 /DNA_END=269 /DNA_ORIENTATION=+
MTRTSVTVTSFAGASSAAGPRRSRVDLVCCTQGQRRRPPRGRAWCTYNAGQTVVQAASISTERVCRGASFSSRAAAGAAAA